jgi:hypothetical protein
MKTLVIYIRAGQRYQRIFNGAYTASQAQMELLKQGVGCQKVLRVMTLSGGH